LSINWTSLRQSPLAGVWNDALQWPVERFQILTTPSESLEIAIPSLAWRVMDLIGELWGIGFGSVTSGDIDEALICQNFTDPSEDAEMREVGEENTKEVIRPLWPMKDSMGQSSELVMSYT
jgi:hypothetical protein